MRFVLIYFLLFEMWSFIVSIDNFYNNFFHSSPIFQVAFKLSDALANKEDENINKKEEKDSNKKEDRDTITNDVKDKIKVPREYKMVLSKVEQSMGVFSEGTAGCTAYAKFFLFNIVTERHKSRLVYNVLQKLVRIIVQNPVDMGDIRLFCGICSAKPCFFLEISSLQKLKTFSWDPHSCVQSWKMVQAIAWSVSVTITCHGLVNTLLFLDLCYMYLRKKL